MGEMEVQMQNAAAPSSSSSSIPAPAPSGPSQAPALAPAPSGPSQAPALAPAPPRFEKKKHAGFWIRHLRMLPKPYQGGDSQRMTLGYFCLAGLDLLGMLEEKVPLDERREIADWVWARQLSAQEGGGFRGSPSLGPDTHASGSKAAAYDTANLAMTYTALIILAILRDDFTRLDRAGILRHVGALQQADGSFAPAQGQLECDARFVFCAFAICYMLDDWSSINVDAAVGFLLRTQSYDGAFGQAPMQESHGGSTYCALAALSLAGRLSDLDDPGLTLRWLLARQGSGTAFNGRLEKPVDSCYSFWCGAGIAILDGHDLIDARGDMTWLLSAQSPIGGISKTSDDPPDVMHSYLSMAALAMHVRPPKSNEKVGIGGTASVDADVDAMAIEQMKEGMDLQETHPALNVSLTSLQWLKQALGKTQ